MKRIIALVILFLPSLAFGVTYINTVPYNCIKTGEAYILAKDVWTTGTAITISTDNVILNLNGKTIIFGTANGKCNGIETTWNKNNIEIFGGKIIHAGVGNPPGCNGIFIQEVSTNIKIHSIEILVKSRATATVYEQSCGILMLRARNPMVYDCVIDNQASEVVNRHSIPAVGIDIQLDSVNVSTSCRVYSNRVSTTHMGIRVGGGHSGGNEVYKNTVTVNQIATNPYAFIFRDLNGLKTYSNIVNAINGRGLLFEHIDNFDCYDNQITAREKKTAEAFQTHGIRIRYGARYGRIRNNIINVYAGEPGYGGAYGIRITSAPNLDSSNPQDVEIEFSDNAINAITYDLSKPAYGIYFEDVRVNNKFIFKDNITSSNYRPIHFESSWETNGNIICGDLKLYRTKIKKHSQNSSSFHTYYLGGGARPLKNIFMIDTVYENGANEDDIGFYGDNIRELAHVSACKFTVKDIGGNQVSGATVKLTNRLGEQVVYGTTNANGEYISEVSYKKHSKSGGKTDFNPFRLTASYDCRVGSKQINVSNINKEFTATLPSKKTFPCP
jgi:hypothetical protein